MGPPFRASPKVAAIFVAVVGVSLWLVPDGCGCSTWEGAYMAGMRSDLRFLQRAQSSYHADHGTYAASLSALLAGISAEEGFQRLQPSYDVVTLVIDAATRDGFSAHASHLGTAIRCVIWEGDMIRPDYPNAIRCTEPDGKVVRTFRAITPNNDH